MLDGCGRSIDYLRISVTDRCNLRCAYCMPEQGVKWVDHHEILSYEEILRLVELAASLGVRRVRLTGGEPLVRRGLSGLAAGIKAIPGIQWLGLTTNGVLLEKQLPALLEARLDGVNISLDALDRARYAAITRRDGLPAALAGLEAALAAPGLTVKVNCVPTGDNTDQWVPLARLARTRRVDVRFIELMPIGLGAGLSGAAQGTVLAALEGAFGPAALCPPSPGGGPGRYVRFDGFTGRVGFISAMSHPFCAGCNRVRLTAGGFFKTCLQYGDGADLRALLRAGAGDDAIRSAMSAAIRAKPAAHHFGTGPALADEGRNMNQIGG